MKVHRILWSIAVLTLALTFAGCGGGGTTDGSVQPPTQPILGEVVPNSNGVTAFNQTIKAMDSIYSFPPFPGQANYWDLDTDFSLGDGGDDQFDGALQLAINGAPFPGDQLYSDLTFLTPYHSAADGVKVAAVDSLPDFPSLSGTYSAWLAGTSDSRLQQTVDLTGIPGPLTLTWNDQVFADPGNIADSSDVPYYQVVVRDASTGVVLDTPLLNTTLTTFNPSSAPNHTADLSVYAGEIILLSFETRGTNLIGYATVDDVSLTTSNGGENLLINGDFETGDLSGWTTNAPQELQNVTSGVRPLEGLNVTRSFYTVPNRLWGRWVDVFVNPGSAPVPVSVTYTTDLGHDNGTPGAGTGMIAYTPGTTGALSSWDNLAGDHDRDVGLVFGRAAEVLFDAPSAVDLTDGNDLITVSYNITVPGFGRRALVNFVVMNGIDTGEIHGVTASSRPDEIDAENIKILGGYGTDPQYQEGMTQEQIESVVNF